MKLNRVLVPIDFSERSRAALLEADALAAAQGAQLTLLHVHPVVEVAIMDFTYVQPPEKIAEVVQAADRHLREWAQSLQTPSERLEISVTTGGPAIEIVELSRQYDLVVMATHGRTGVSHFLMGSVTERVVQGAHCSVLIIKQKKS